MRACSFVRRLLPAAVVLCSAIRLAAADPPAGQLVAGIDVGGKGAKLVVLRVSVGRTERVEAKTVDPTPLADVGPDGGLSVAGIDRTTAAVDELVKLARETHHVPADKVSVIGSSGLAAAPNRAKLAAAVEKRAGVPMSFLSADEEAVQVFRGLVPPAERETAMAMDFGSGNMRVAGAGRSPDIGRWHVHGTRPFGTVSLTTRPTDAKGLDQTFTEMAAGHPTLTHHRRTCYLSGGIVWAACTVLKPAECDAPVVRLTAADLTAFADLVDKSDTGKPPVDTSALRDPKARAAADAEVRRVFDTFTGENLRNGAAVLRAAAKAYRLDEKDLRFRRDGQFAWILARLQPDPVEPPPTSAVLWASPSALPPCPPVFVRCR